jgi:hypothetical protein
VSVHVNYQECKCHQCNWLNATPFVKALMPIVQPREEKKECTCIAESQCGNPHYAPSASTDEVENEIFRLATDISVGHFRDHNGLFIAERLRTLVELARRSGK